MRFAIFGTGFWSRYQLAAWREVKGAECVALYNRTRSKAEALARRFGVPAVYDDPERLLASETLDFIDVITDVDTHSLFVKLAADHKIDVVCQKPMAPTQETAASMLSVCSEAGIKLLIHENWRWQTPIRQVRRLLEEERIGPVFRARIEYCCSFPVFDNQPFLKGLDKFILADIGSHILDTARFLFGEAESLYCQTHRVHRDIKGEDVATVVMKMTGNTIVVCDMSYASRTRRERFPETFMTIEGERGSIELCPDFWIRVTDASGTSSERYPPPHYAWADPAYDLVMASIVPCNVDILAGLQDKKVSETAGADNYETVRLVSAAYESARENKNITL